MAGNPPLHSGERVVRDISRVVLHIRPSNYKGVSAQQSRSLWIALAYSVRGQLTANSDFLAARGPNISISLRCCTLIRSDPLPPREAGMPQLQQSDRTDNCDSPP